MVCSCRCLFFEPSANEADQKGAQEALKLSRAILRLSLDS
jgi:hypothetical protein